MMDEAIYLAVKTNIPEVFTYCMMYANIKKDIVSINLLNYHTKKSDEEGNLPSRQTSFIQSMTQVANFTRKVLKKEDYLNLYKDFDTLLKIDDISDLELTDFNGWEFNLDRYQKALEFELQGDFDAALEIYQQNEIQADIERVKMLKAELGREIRDGEKHLVFQNVKDIFFETD